MRKHLVVPDPQVKPGVSIRHAYWLAYYAMDKEPDVVVFLGDVYDMPSLSSYDARGSGKAEGRRIHRDLEAGHQFVDTIGEIWDKRGFDPTVHVTLGNHENRIDRAVNDFPHLLDQIVGTDTLAFGDWGWKVHPFLVPVSIDGISYCHFFPHNARGQVTQTKRGAPNARAQVQRTLGSATAGHQQGLDVAIVPGPKGLRRGIIAGSYYLHKEDYMPTNNYWRGLILKHEVRQGEYGLCEASIKFLERKYKRLEPAGRKIA